ncbi:hypothetical protein QQ020_14465 [Fulvivirgaceae bacterium BMA12]|uniref:Uncharacterized protein n=1 Tax=Agaribacillus aureus TaxID=3051825 RepID=A0ABT8L6A9_9BACT|nr:hypothetical protein [Fulvivirgaceae bacterium BMA12]
MQVLSIILARIPLFVSLFLGFTTNILRSSKDNQSLYSFSNFQLWWWTSTITPLFSINWGFVPLNLFKFRLHYLSIILLVCSCSSKSYIHLATDSVDTAPDKNLIRGDISVKKQFYILKKSFYKNRDRKKALRQIESLSDIGLELFISGKLSEEKYNELQNEAKYVIQHAIYRMKIENYSEDEDPILDYLKTGINSLKLILADNGTI